LPSTTSPNQIVLLCTDFLEEQRKIIIDQQTTIKALQEQLNNFEKNVSEKFQLLEDIIKAKK